MRLLLLSTTILLTLTACINISPLQRPKTQTIKLSSKFDSNSASYILNKGTATITGSASLTDANGETISCAGNNVFLVPITEYSTERYRYLFGDTKNQFASDEVIFHVRFKPDHPDFRKYMRVSTCNYVGEFSFDNVPAGEYYLGTNIISEVEGYNTIQGGALANTIIIKEKDIIEVNLR